MNILVTGANGQLGNEIKTIAENLPQWNFIFTDIDTLDITNEQAVSEFFASRLPSFVINCAAYTAVDKAETDIETARKINSEAPGILARAANALESYIIQVSTDYVFDGQATEPYIETDSVNPLGVYGKTKLEGELNCLFENPRSIVIRTSWLYSTFGNNFVKSMIKLGNERAELSVVNDQIGSPTYAADLASVILLIIALCENEPDSFVPGVYHYSNEGCISWYDFAKKIFELTGSKCQLKPIKTSDYPTAAKRPQFSVMDKSKIKYTFGVDIPDWKESLEICINKL